MTVRSHELRKVRREQAQERRLTDEQRQRIRERMEASRDRDRGPQAERTRQHNAVVTGLVPRIGAAINGWTGKRVPFSVSYPAIHFSAATDFESIRINIPEENVDIDFAADLRGLAYHEAGHILKSVPFPVMMNEVLPGANAHVARRFMTNVIGLDERLIHHAWNMLEDQRMESAMVRESVNLARYYNVIVLTHVATRMTANSYLLLYGRKHVDETVRAAARTAFISENGEAVCLDAERLIDTYKRSVSLQEMWECTIHFARIVGRLRDDGGMDSVDNHDNNGWCEDEEENPGRNLSDSAAPDEGEGGSKDGSEDEGGEEDEEDEEDDENEGQSDAADRNAVGEEGDSDTPGASKSIGERDWTRDLLREALERAKEERRHDGHVTRDVRAYNEALAHARDSMPIKRIPALPDPDPAQTAEALKLNRSLRTLMDQARAQTAPSWQVGQSRGILDVRAYVTRQPGDMDFYRSYTPGGDMRLPDMAVSVLLDGSGSMTSYAQELAVAAFGIKSACDTCSVPCTVMVYDTDAFLLWDKDDRPIEVPYDIVPNGGTDPKRALDLIDTQRYERRNHLVILMTDGAWSGRWHTEHSLAHYQAPDRDMVMFYYQCSPLHGPNGTDTCSLAVQINDLQEMPKYLRQYLLRAM
jgi:hypothetical protein